jgi:hypothetical protein
MGQGSINSYQNQQRSSPLEGILAGLKAAHEVYGISAAKDASDLLARQSDPNSSESKAAQAEQALFLDAAQKKGYATPEAISKLKQLTLGTPGKDAIPTAGPAEEDGTTPEIPAVAAVPGLSAAALAKNSELGPFSKFVTGAQSAEAMATKFNSINDTKKEMQENTIHTQILGKLQKDPVMSQRLGQYQNLSNALNNFLAVDHPLPQDFDDLQQSVIQNMGLKGQQLGEERVKKQFDSLGLKGDRWIQLITGNGQDIAKDGSLVSHVRNMATLEQGNVQRQMQSRMKAVTSGNEWLYHRRPDLKAGLDSAIQEYGNQFSNPAAVANEKTAQGGSPFPGSDAQAGEKPPQSAPGIHPETISAAQAILNKRLKQNGP